MGNITTVERIRESALSRVRFCSDNGIQVLSRSTRSQLADVLTEIEGDVECRVVLFEAAGRTFLAGADITELTTLTAAEAEQLALETQELFRRIENLSAVTIAAIQATSAGGGFELTLACDLRIAAETARVGFPEVRLGLIPGWGGTVRSTKLFGTAITKQLILTGELISATDALRLGLVESIHSANDFPAAIDARIASLLQCGKNACGTVKSLIAALEPEQYNAQFAIEAKKFGVCFGTAESQEGLQAFREKRKASWCDG